MSSLLNAANNDRHSPINWRRPAILAIILFVVMVFVGQLPVSRFVMHIQVLSWIFAVLAASWDLLIGYAGQLSFGHAAFFAVGGYTSALLSGELGVSPWLGLFLGGLMASIIGIVFGLPALRLRGPYLALTTLALSETIKVVIENWSGLTQGHHGYTRYEAFPGIPFSRVNYYYLGLAFCTIVLLTLYLIAERSRIGLAWRSLRDDEIRARSLGLDITKYKLIAFALSAFVAGMAGSFYAHYINLVAPTMADLNVTALAVAMAVLGGRGTIFGAVLGAFILENISQHLRALGIVFNEIGTGAIIVLMIWLFPEGIIGLFRRYIIKKDKSVSEGSKPTVTILSDQANNGKSLTKSDLKLDEIETED